MGILDPFEFSNIPGYPNKFDRHRCFKSISTFHKGKDTVTAHITKFKEVLVAWDITDEDTMMQLFVMSLDLGENRDVDASYDGLPPKEISSYLQLVEAF